MKDKNSSSKKDDASEKTDKTPKKAAAADDKDPKKDVAAAWDAYEAKKGKEPKKSAEGGKAESSTKHVAPGFLDGQELQYLSAKFNTWVPCKVTKVDNSKNA